MNKTVKIIAYAVLSLALVLLGAGLLRSVRSPEPKVSMSGTTNTADSTTNSASADGEMTTSAPSGNAGGWIKYFAGLLAVAVLLGALAAYDFSNFMGRRAEEFIFNDNLEGVHDPEYEEAEKVWANGDHLQAIQLMRDYLKKHPLEQYVALRIAEIYEKDLGNHLAAALEYEEVLKKKLPAERWGWAAIHLANIYSGKLNKSNEAMALLNRIVEEYGHTAAAKKARERLGLPESALATPAETPAVPTDDAKASNLPPGFRPK